MGIIVSLMVMNWLLMGYIVFAQKKDPQAAWAWILFLFFFPVLGPLLYFFTGQEIPRRKKEFEKNLVGRLTEDNYVKIFSWGEDKYNSLLTDIKQAKKEILLQYYIIKNDGLLEILEENLVKKAAEGVKVRILYDPLGSRKLKKDYRKKLRKKGIEIRGCKNKIFSFFSFGFNYRNHRKIAVIDEYIGYIGGFNIGKEYLGMDPRFGAWRDTHLRITGGAAAVLRQVFQKDWGENTEDPVKVTGKGGVPVQIVTSGPASIEPHIRNTYLRLIAGAREKIWIQTPYFIPDSSIMTALKLALLSGKEVKIMIPCKPDHMFVYWATLAYAGELLEMGAQIYVYSRGFLHAKGMIMDEMVYSYGSANMDIRSFYLNYEINAIVYEAKEVEEMCRLFREDMEQCHCLTKEEYGSRDWKIKAKEQISRLLSPLL